MLERSQAVNYKHAIFLTENAFHEGQLDEKWYINKIDSIERICRTMIAEKHLEKQTTSGNWAIFSYLKQPSSYNNFESYTYDPDNFNHRVPESNFVYSLLKMKKGTCHSLPYLYLILAQELSEQGFSAEAYLALAPMHQYIKQQDQFGEWWNLELTTGTFSRSSFIKETFEISDEQVANGLYMRTLDWRKILVCFMEDLTAYYEHRTGVFYDDFSLRVADLGNKYSNPSFLLMSKFDILHYRLDKDMKKVGLNDYGKIESYPDLVSQYHDLQELRKKIDKTGYKKVSEEWYKGMVKKALEANAIKN